MTGLTGAEILALRHTVWLDPHCTLATIYGTTGRMVNTIHHQAVTDAGQLRVVGRGTGNVIEALESEDQETWPALGVQWHPEKMREPLEARLFLHFVNAAARYAQAKQRFEPLGG